MSFFGWCLVLFLTKFEGEEEEVNFDDEISGRPLGGCGAASIAALSLLLLNKSLPLLLLLLLLVVVAERVAVGVGVGVGVGVAVAVAVAVVAVEVFAFVSFGEMTVFFLPFEDVLEKRIADVSRVKKDPFLLSLPRNFA